MFIYKSNKTQRNWDKRWQFWESAWYVRTL